MKEYDQIVNLVKFNVNFSKFISNNELLSHSPDYVLEKYNHWIGFNPTVDHKTYTPDDMTDFFNKYWKMWRPSSDDINSKLKNILMYLNSTKNMNLLVMVNKFEEYIGPVSMISDIPDKKGLHHHTAWIVGKFVDDVLKKNDDIKTVLRDLRINSIIS